MQKEIKWTLLRASVEFGIDRITLRSRLQKLGIVEDKFTTAQILKAVQINTTIEQEKLRKTKEEADEVALRNEKSRGNLIDIETVKKAGEGIFVSFRQKILSSSLLDSEKDEILNDLRNLKTRDWTK